MQRREKREEAAAVPPFSCRREEIPELYYPERKNSGRESSSRPFDGYVFRGGSRATGNTGGNEYNNKSGKRWVLCE